MSTWTNPGSSFLKGFGLAVAAEGSSCSRNTLKLETLCRRKQRLKPERETVVLRNSCVTANRSSTMGVAGWFARQPLFALAQGRDWREGYAGGTMPRQYLDACATWLPRGG